MSKTRPRSQPISTGLHISEPLTLPLEAVTETFAILGRRGSGKTSTAVVLAEETIRAGVPVVIVDPTGAWWGLRSSADGKGDGLPVVIFGGDHADVPLDEKAGEVIADAIVEGRFPAIIDLSTISKSAMRRFMTDFAERLYRRNRDPLHLVIDEADVLVPQRLASEGLRVFGAIDDIVRRGRIRGIGVTLISQRPAVINKDVLSQIEVLVALQLTSKIDVAAIDDWVRLNATDEEAKVVKASLASLPTGTGWVWSPALLGILEKVAIRRRTTFDSSATPKPGQQRLVAEAFAPVDTAALGAKITALAEQAADSDPRALKAKVARLERDLATARSATAPAGHPEVVEKRVEVPVLTPENQRAIEEATERIRTYAANACERAEQALGQIKAEVASLGEILAHLSQQDTPAAPLAPVPAAKARLARRQPPKPAPRATQNGPVRVPALDQTRSSTAERSQVTEGLTPARRRILDALADMEGIGVAHARKKQVALWAGVSPKSSGFANNLGALRSAGLIDYPGPGLVALTDAGREHAHPPEHAVDNEELHARIQPLVSPARWRILAALIAAYPHAMKREELAYAVDASPASSGFTNNLGALRSLGLLDYPATGTVIASDLLFVEGD